MPRRFVFLLFLAVSVFGQQVRIGVKGGVRVLSEFEANVPKPSESRRYVVGPYVEFRLPILGLNFEADALYSRFGYSNQGGSFGSFFVTRSRANSWEFPFLLKKHLPIPLIKPYAVGGYAPRLTSESEQTTATSSPFPFSNPTRNRWTHGLVAGGGIDTGVGRIRLSPEVRYTRWNEPFVNETNSRGYYVRSSQNQVQVLLGISWKVR